MTAPLTLAPAWRVVGHAVVALLCLSVLVPMLVVFGTAVGIALGYCLGLLSR